MRDREFKNKSDYNLVMSIKENAWENTLTSFQEYWKARCMNQEYLTFSQMYSIFYQFAIDNFNRGDWYQFFREFGNTIVRPDFGTELFERSVNVFIMCIDTMTMRYDD